MKNNIIKFMVFTSAGAILHTVPLAAANDGEFKVKSQAATEYRDIDSVSKDSDRQHSKMKRASEVIGKEVRGQGDEKIGEVKDLIVDLQSGRVPFTVVSSGGFFGVGSRLMAVPSSSLTSANADDALHLSVNQEKLRSAPNFDANNWPDMNNESWEQEIYSFYGPPMPPTAEIASTRSSTIQERQDFARTEINEPAGAQRPSDHYSGSASQRFGETESGLSRDRTPRQGLGAEDLTQNEQKIYNPGGYAESDSFIRTEAAGAERTTRETNVRRDTRNDLRVENSGKMHSGKARRASELIGMEVKNPQGERVGEIEDVVIDMQSGRIAYTVVSAGGYADMGDKLFAVPPSVFTRSTDEKTLVFNTDKERLKSAPSFNQNNWESSNNPQFTTEVYRFYRQEPYWQTSGEIREPAGSQQQNFKQKDDSSSEWQKGYRNTEQFESRPELNDPSGADLEAQPQQEAPDSANPQGAPLNDPSGAEPERNLDSALPSPSDTAPEPQTDSSAAKETAELEAAQNPAEEPAGAAATRPATSDDQAGSDADRALSQRLRTTLQSDVSLSGSAQNVQVSAANGRVVLRGTVESEQQKQAISQKAEEIAGSADKVDNQLQVRPQSNTP